MTATMSKLEDRLERIWQLLMVFGEDAMARDVAEAKAKLIRQDKQLRGEPVVIDVTVGDETSAADGAG